MGMCGFPFVLQVWRYPWQFAANGRFFIQSVRLYFGEKIAFYFMFLHFYTSWLLGIAVPGIGIAVYEYMYGIDQPLIPAYSIWTAIWGVLLHQFWLRQQSTFSFNWGMDEYYKADDEIDYALDLKVRMRVRV